MASLEPTTVPSPHTFGSTSPSISIAVPPDEEICACNPMASLEPRTAPSPRTFGSTSPSISIAVPPDEEIRGCNPMASLEPRTTPSPRTFGSTSPSISIAVPPKEEICAYNPMASLEPISATHHRVVSTSITSAASPKDDSCCYDVFINYRAFDVKKTLASHLYRSLLRKGLRVFPGKKGVNSALEIEVIRTASVHVAIFSPTYANSTGCLDELLQMFDSAAPIIPVLYHVKPAELRWTQGKNGVYSRSLRKLEKKKIYDSETNEEKPRHDPRTIEKWREALSRAADITGFEVDANNTDEGELLDKVVESVVNHMKMRCLHEAAEDSKSKVTHRFWSEAESCLYIILGASIGFLLGRYIPTSVYLILVVLYFTFQTIRTYILR